MLQEREFLLQEKMNSHEQNVARFKEKLSKVQSEEQKLKIRKQQLDTEWERIDLLRQNGEKIMEENRI